MPRDRLADVCKSIGVAPDAIEGVGIVLLPENAVTAESANELYDTPDSIAFAKYLKEEGASFKSAFDLGLKPKIKDRRAIDLWMGVVWFTGGIAVPVFVNLLSNFLQKKIGSEQSARVHIDLRMQRGDEVSTLDFDGSASDFLDIIDGLKQRRQGRIEE